MNLQLRATLPIHIFISPNLPLDENNNLIDQSHQAAQTIDFYLSQQAPPLYGEHQFDLLYGDLDPNGYFTPGNYSGITSPIGALSRNLSVENLAVLPGRRPEDICAHTLHSRLTNLHINGSGPSTPPPETLDPPGDEIRRRSYNNDQLPSIMTELATPGHSRRSSEEGQILSGLATPNPHFIEVEDLCRVPSYSTALRSSAKMYYDGALPDYQTATASGATAPPILLSPNTRRTSRLFGILDVPPRPHFTVHHRGSSSGHSSDAERQVRIMQERARG